MKCKPSKTYLTYSFRDGTIRVWSCGKGRCLEPPISIDDVANSCDILNFGESPYLMTSSAGDSIGENTF